MTRLNIQAGCFFDRNHVYCSLGYPKVEMDRFLSSQWLPFICRIRLTGYHKLIDSDA